jgi:hypothetical protein
MKEIKRPRGRPFGTLRTNNTATIPSKRCTPEQREKFERLGGWDWLLPKIDAAREK